MNKFNKIFTNSLEKIIKMFEDIKRKKPKLMKDEINGLKGSIL